MRVYLDSMVWIYFLDANADFGPDSKELMKRLLAPEHTLLSSFLIEAEVLVLPKRNADRFTEVSYKRFFASAGVVSIPILRLRLICTLSCERDVAPSRWIRCTPVSLLPQVLIY
jgi:predicted nucleic acid-binding protein